MIRHKRREKNSIYHASFYQYKKRTSVGWYLLLTLLILICVVLVANAQASENVENTARGFHAQDMKTLNEVGSGQLLFEATNKEAMSHAVRGTSVYHPAAMLKSDASFNINGPIATVTLTQSFINQSDVALNGVYTFPLPDNSAVNRLTIQIGNRLIEGEIMEKAQAKKVFLAAKKAGKKSSLVRQHRPNIFTNNVANIGAKEQITVTITYVQHVNFDQDEFSIRFPMMITPRYESKGNAADNTHHQLSQLSQLLLAANDSTLKPTLNKDQYMTMNIALNAGVELANVASTSHRIKYKQRQYAKGTGESQSSRYDIFLENGRVPMDRDFVLTWRPQASDLPQVSLFSQQINNEHYALAMMIPPSHSSSNSSSIDSSLSNSSSINKAQSEFSRDVTFIIDTSGSMQGASIEQAKQSLIFALRTLVPEDSFNIIAFASRHQQLFTTTVLASDENLRTATNFIEGLSANGGTEMYGPLNAALSMTMNQDQKPEAVRQVMFITDGAVGNELELFKLIRNASSLPRLFTVGIGAAPNGYFMRKAAQFGQGSYTYISNVNDIENKMSALLDKISRPALRNIALQFQPLHLGTVEQYPSKIPDLYFGEPLVVAFKTSIVPSSVQVFGEQVDRGWHQELMFTENRSADGITSIWARAKIEDLLDGLVLGKSADVVREQVLATSLLHQVMSPYTSFIAVEKAVPSDYENSAELAMNRKADGKNKNLKTSAARQMVATQMPQTAVGWKFELLLGCLMLIIAARFRANRKYRHA